MLSWKNRLSLDENGMRVCSHPWLQYSTLYSIKLAATKSFFKSNKITKNDDLVQQEHSFLLDNTWVWYPVHIWWFTIICNFTSRESDMNSLLTHSSTGHMWCTYTHTRKILFSLNNINISKNSAMDKIVLLN